MRLRSLLGSVRQSSRRRRRSPPAAATLTPRSTTGSCPCGCDYTKDPGCTCRNLQQDLRVSLQKTPVYASYPLTAHRTPFNGAPYEVRASIVQGG